MCVALFETVFNEMRGFYRLSNWLRAWTDSFLGFEREKKNDMCVRVSVCMNVHVSVCVCV